ncbi:MULTISPECIES: O-antigen ligase family protein [Bacillus cereus group]|uniref:O-antigen ligase family protein n=1 Tax=Bacillus cereus group TaxID=86661 RepID=UPI0011EFA57D|nr:O-antigen ligase family protein [Bacillus sp. TE8-1]KAA0767580.1 tripartite tricarboxylate transporter TctB family protein [Bacillus sp. TE8-1]
MEIKDFIMLFLFFSSIILLVVALIKKIKKKPIQLWIYSAIILFTICGLLNGIRSGIVALLFIISVVTLFQLIFLFINKQPGKKKSAIILMVGFISWYLIAHVLPHNNSNETVKENSKENITSDETSTDESKEDVKKETKETKETTYTQYGTEEIKSMFTIGMSVKDFEDKKEGNKIKVRNYNRYNPGGLYTFDTKDGQIVAVVLNEKEIIKVETLNNEEALGTFIKEEENRMNEEKRIAKEEADKKLKESYENNKQKLEGSGDSVTHKVNLKSGLAFFDFNNTGSRNFIVHLKNASGNDVGLLVNTIGSYKGKVSTTIPASGEYYLEVKSSGNWNAAITQETPLVSESVPGTINGHGDDVVFINVPNGNHIVKLKHTGSRNFIIKVNDQNLLVNKIGAYEGSSSHVFKDLGMYSFGVKADGDWSITIE